MTSVESIVRSKGIVESADRRAHIAILVVGRIVSEAAARTVPAGSLGEEQARTGSRGTTSANADMVAVVVDVLLVGRHGCIAMGRRAIGILWTTVWNS